MPLLIAIPQTCDECTQCSENRWHDAPAKKKYNRWCDFANRLIKSYPVEHAPYKEIPDWCPIRNGGLVRKEG